MKKLIVCDFDGTMYSKSGEQPFLRLLELIKTAKGGDVTFAVASGRPLFSLKKYFEPIYDDIYIASCDGALLSKGKKTLFETPIDISALENEQNFAFYGRLIAYIKYDSLNLGRQLFKQFDGHVMNIDTTEEISENIYKVCFYGSDANIENLKKIYDKNNIYEYISQNAGKKSAVDFLKTYLNIIEDNIYVFGDSENDIELLAGFENSFAMESAEIKVKKAANYVCGDIEKEIKKIILN